MRSVHPRRRGKGFTLIEMLVVLSIIGILMGVLVPLAMRAMVRAEMVKCRSQLGEIFKAVLTYSNDYLGLMPPGLLAGGTGEGSEGVQATNLLWDPKDERVGLGVLWNEEFPDEQDYIGDPSVFFCPGAEQRTEDGERGLRHWNSGTAAVESSYLYRGNSAGASLYLDKNQKYDRAIAMDYNTYNEADNTGDYNHDGRRVNILYAHGKVDEVENIDEHFTCFSEGATEYEKVFQNADQRKALEGAPTPTPETGDDPAP